MGEAETDERRITSIREGLDATFTKGKPKVTVTPPKPLCVLKDIRICHNNCVGSQRPGEGLTVFSGAPVAFPSGGQGKPRMRG